MVTECFVDPVGSGGWILTLWTDRQLKDPEVFLTEEAALGRAEAIRVAQLNEGWTELRTL